MTRAAHASNDSMDGMKKTGGAESLSSLLTDVTGTKGFNALLADFIPVFFRRWAGRNIFRRIAAWFISRSIRKGFRKQSESSLTPGVGALVSDPEFAKSLGARLPEIANSAADIICAVVKGIEGLPINEKEAFFDTLLSRTGRGATGEMLTGIARIVNEIHRSDPEFFSRRISIRAARWIERTDFGELKELFDRSQPDIVAAVRAVNATLWHYPAKVICLLSILPRLLNIMADSLKETAAPLNSMAPDLLTDVLLSLVRDLDGRAIGGLINEMSELIRKLHTGSALIGEKGNPRIPAAVSEKIRELLGAVDVALLLKARALFAELREQVLAGFIDITGERPELMRALIHDRFRSAMTSVRLFSLRAGACETLFSREEFAEELARGIHEIDAPQIAEIIRRICAMANNLHRHSPGAVRNILSQAFSSLDAGEVGETARWLTEDVVESLKPIAREVVPPVIRGIAELVDPGLYSQKEELRDAIHSLRGALKRLEEAQ